MTKITMLGTGNGITLDLYNTCFAIQNENGSFLIDTGGGGRDSKKIRISRNKITRHSKYFYLS